MGVSHQGEGGEGVRHTPLATAVPPRGSLTGGKKKKCSGTAVFQKDHGYHMCSTVMGWRLAVGGSWRLVAVGGWWWLTLGGGCQVVFGGSWWLVVGGWWRLAAVGGWRLVAVGGWRQLAVGGWSSLRAVLSKTKQI